MPADTLSREEIERFLAFRGDYLELRREHVHELARHALDEPTRLAAARAEGIQEGIEMAAKAAGFAAWRYEGDDARSQGMDAGARHQVAECVKAIKALSPPSEPDTTRLGHTDLMVSPEAIDRVLAAEPSAPVVEGFEKPAPGASITEIEAAGYRNTILVLTTRIATLKAENAKLREGLKDTTAHLVAAHDLLSRTPRAKKAAPSNTMFDMMLRDYEASCERARTLLQGDSK